MRCGKPRKGPLRLARTSVSDCGLAELLSERSLRSTGCRFVSRPTFDVIRIGVRRRKVRKKGSDVIPAGGPVGMAEDRTGTGVDPICAFRPLGRW
ncbi:unnamed protein product, partial [Iphiclides podalirius]